MVEIYVLDKNLKPVGIVDDYNSLIWAERYSDLGDCEIYLTATEEHLNLLKEGNYISRSDDDMICRIVKHTIETDEDKGDFLTVTGKDARCLLWQRIVYGTQTVSGYLETFVRSLVTQNFITPDNAHRKMLKDNDEPLILLDDPEGLADVITGQLAWDNIGEQIRRYCITFNYGFRLRYDRTANVLRFGIYKGHDRHDEVVFSRRFDNLAKSKYEANSENITNVAVVGGVGTGSGKATGEYGEAYGIDRHEAFFDAKDISNEITWAEMTSLYPTQEQGGYGYIIHPSSGYRYVLSTMDIQIMSDWHLADLRMQYPSGSVVYVEETRFYRMSNVEVASVPSSAPADSDTVILFNILYKVYLMTKGLEALRGRVVSFDSSVIPDITFRYRTDYNVGDIVTIENGYGITARARIVEVVESYDDTGYKLEPKLEYLDLAEGKPEGQGDLLTEGGLDIMTETSVNIQT